MNDLIFNLRSKNLSYGFCLATCTGLAATVFLSISHSEYGWAIVLLILAGLSSLHLFNRGWPLFRWLWAFWLNVALVVAATVFLSNASYLYAVLTSLLAIINCSWLITMLVWHWSEA